MIVQSNSSLVPARSAHSLNALFYVTSGFPAKNAIYILYAWREVIHDYINVTFSQILFPFFFLVPWIVDIASSILATIQTDSQSQIRSTSNVRPSNKTTKCVRSWNSREVARMLHYFFGCRHLGKTYKLFTRPTSGIIANWYSDLHSAHVKWYRHSKGPWFGRRKRFTRPVVAILTLLRFFGGGLDLC